MSSFDFFSLTPSIISDIIFALEDQENVYVFDLLSRKCVLESKLDEFEQPYALNLPSWTTNDGYSLMLSFSKETNNKDLSNVFKSGNHGVFKLFKEKIKALDLTNDWYKFKEKKMTEYISDWFGKAISDIQYVLLSNLPDCNDFICKDEILVFYDFEDDFLNKFNELFSALYKFSVIYEDKLVGYFIYSVDDGKKTAYIFKSSFISNVDYIKINIKKAFLTFLSSKRVTNIYVFDKNKDKIEVTNHTISPEDTSDLEYL